MHSYQQGQSIPEGDGVVGDGVDDVGGSRGGSGGSGGGRLPDPFRVKRQHGTVHKPKIKQVPALHDYWTQRC